MEKFKYLPQSIVAYDKKGFDKTANLIHAATAIQSKDYYCPCCGNVLRVSCLNSEYKQEYFFHKDGECSKEARLRWFCENWLLNKGSQFSIENNIYTVKEIKFDQVFETPFGSYSPSLVVETEENIKIFFELFFNLNKVETDYFCKWKYLDTDVVKVDLDELQNKQKLGQIINFSYLYHDNKCYSKEYVKKDLYAQTIGLMQKGTHSRQQVIDEKISIERLDRFWIITQQKTINKDELLNYIKKMTHEEKLVCYEIVSNKQCLKYLKNDVADIINEDVIEYLRSQVDLPKNENVYLDLWQHSARTFEIGIVLDYKPSDDFYIHTIPYHVCVNKWHDSYYLKESNLIYTSYIFYDAVKIVFKKKIYDFESVKLNMNYVGILKEAYSYSVQKLDEIKKFFNEIQNIDAEKYSIIIDKNKASVLIKDCNNEWKKVVNDMYHEFNVQKILKNADSYIKEVNKLNFCKKYFESERYRNIIKDYSNLNNCKVALKYNSELNVNIDIIIDYYHEYGTIHISDPITYIFDNEDWMDNFIKEKLEQFFSKFTIISERRKNIGEIFNQINSCKNGLWYIEELGTNYFLHLYYKSKKGKVIQDFKAYIPFHEETDNIKIKQIIYTTMKNLLLEAELKGIRYLEVR